MIQKIDDSCYVISSHHAWLPGAYESERAARYAFRFSHEQLQKLQDSVNPGGIITLEMLKKLHPSYSGSTLLS